MQCDGKRGILYQRVPGSVRAVRAVWNTRVFQTDSKVVANVGRLSTCSHFLIRSKLPPFSGIEVSARATSS
jgi:hypothetical protein